MGWLGRLLGFGRAGAAPVTLLADATTNVAEVFVENKTRKMELGASAHQAALAQFAAEFTHARRGFFDRFVDALNRLPRPLMALGTLWLFVQAWYDRDSFVRVMEALIVVPDPLWFLLGAIVTFYFGARESHHWRARSDRTGAFRAARHAALPDIDATGTFAPIPAADFEAINSPSEPNAALAEWRKRMAQEDATS